MTSIFSPNQYARQPPARDASEFRPRIDARVFPLFALQTALAQARGLPASGLVLASGRTSISSKQDGGDPSHVRWNIISQLGDQISA